MSEQFSVELTENEIDNISYVDLAYEILNSSGNTFHYKDLLLEIGHRKGVTQEELENIMGTIYSEINIDGRFLCIESNVWGLMRWYPSEKTAKTGPIPKQFKRNDDDYDDYDLDDDFYLEDEEEYDSAVDDDDDEVDIDAVADDFDIDEDDLDKDVIPDDDEDEDEDDGYDIAEAEAEAEDEDED